MSEIENTELNASAATADAVAGRAEESTDIAIIDERTIRDKIYEIRGVKVMLDFELAQIYGYETKNFNRQVKNNAVKFEGDEFMFRLTRSEVDDLVRCKNLTSRVETLFKGQSGGSRYLPYAFTEQGVYMLMTVLRGDLAVRQSRALVMAFKAMKDYIVENQSLVSQRDLLRISMQTAENTEAIRQMQVMMREHDDKLADVLEQLSATVKSSEIWYSAITSAICCTHQIMRIFKWSSLTSRLPSRQRRESCTTGLSSWTMELRMKKCIIAVLRPKTQV